MFPISLFVMEKMYKFNLNLIKIENQLMCSYNKAFSRHYSRENSYSLPWNSNSINTFLWEKPAGKDNKTGWKGEGEKYNKITCAQYQKISISPLLDKEFIIFYLRRNKKKKKWNKDILLFTATFFCNMKNSFAKQ